MKKFRKLILSLVLLAATAITFASVTFAFVFIQRQTEIDEFDIKLELDEGLLISIDGVNFSNSITEEQIKEHIAGSIQAFNKLKYSGVTPKTINNKLAYDKNGEVEFIKIFGDYASIAPNDNYIKFDLWFKPLVEGAVRKNYGVKVSDDSYFAGNLVDVEVANQVLSGNTIYEAGDKIQVDASNAMRLGVVSEDDMNNFIIYENPNQYDLGSAAIEGSTDNLHNPDRNAMLSYYNKLFPDNPIITAAPNSPAYDTISFKSKDNLIAEFVPDSFGQYAAKKVTVYIWLEGWDADYFSGIPDIGKGIICKLAFDMIDEKCAHGEHYGTANITRIDADCVNRGRIISYYPECGHTVEEVIPATGHDLEVKYSWNLEGTECVATHSCKKENCKYSETEAGKVTVERISTLCDMYYAKSTATFKALWAETQVAKLVTYNNLDSHHFGITNYTWNDDFTECIATRRCVDGCGYEETANAVVTSKKISSSTCELKEKTEYTAAFEVDWASTQTNVEFTSPPLGHLSQITYEWNADYTECVATETCSREGCSLNNTEAKAATVTNVAKTCDEAAYTLYEVKFDSAEFEKQTYKIYSELESDVALGHDYTGAVVTYTWNTDYTECIATHSCIRGCGHKETANAVITNKIIDNAACESIEQTEYTAAFEVDWANTQTTVQYTSPALGHLSQITYEWNADYTECVATETCSREGCSLNNTEAKAATVTNVAKTCDEAAHILYVVEFDSVKFEKQIYKIYSELESDAALGHDYTGAVVTYTWNEDHTECIASRPCTRDNCDYTDEVHATVTSEIVVPAKCDIAADETYTATFDVEWAETQVVKINITLEHIYTDYIAYYDWSADYTECSAIRICTRDDCGHELVETVSTNVKTIKATCSTDGYNVYTADFDTAYTTDQTKTVTTIDALGHKYHVEYEFDANEEKCIAYGECMRQGCSHSVTATAAVEVIDIDGNICEDICDFTYKATFNCAWLQKEIIQVVKVLPIDHNYGRCSYKWSEDYSSCLATIKCTRDGCEHYLEANATVTSTIEKPATDNESGIRVFEATFDVDWAEFQLKKEYFLKE